jgi:hypothetical protein
MVTRIISQSEVPVNIKDLPTAWDFYQAELEGRYQAELDEAWGEWLEATYDPDYPRA